MSRDLILERRVQRDETIRGNAASINPMVHEDYWAYRVQLAHGQAVLGFPKHSTVGVGFALEDDWNANLPYRCETDDVVSHILHNKRFECIEDDDVRRAVLMVQEAAVADRPGRGGIGDLGPIAKVPLPPGAEDDDEDEPELLPCPDPDAHDPVPTTLEEWYEQLVEVAADGNAPPFEWEAERVVRLAAEHARGHHESWCPVLDADSPMESHDGDSCAQAYETDTGLRPPGGDR